MQAQEADKCFAHLPQSGVSLELMTYYYALQIHEHLAVTTSGDSSATTAAASAAAAAHIDAVYVHPPDDVTRRVLKRVKRDHMTDDALDGLVRLFKQSREKLLDFAQVQRLSELGRGESRVFVSSPYCRG